MKLLPEALQTIGHATSDAIGGVAPSCMNAILRGDLKASDADDGQLMNAVMSVYVEAIRSRLPSAQLLDALCEANVRTDRAECIVAAYDEAIATQGAPNVPATHRGMVGAFCPRLLGAQWDAGHCLGDRSQDPPVRSIPFFRVCLSTDSSAPVELCCTVEEAQDLLSKMKDMVHEAERVSNVKSGSRK